MPDTTSYIYNRASLLYFIIIAQANSIVTSSMVAFSSERRLLSRERAKKMYGVLSYFLAKTLADMVNSVALPVCYGMAVYWICGYRATAEAFFTFILILYLTLSASQSTGLFLSIAINNMTIALMLAPFLTLCLMILGGFYIPYDSIHPALSWASWLSMARYGFSAFLINEFDGREIQCDDDDPSNSAFHAEQCPLPGSEVISYFGIEGAWRSVWLNVAMLIAIQVCLRVATYFLLLRAQ
jgi:ABC-type multidrug transport system permease subunit